jgi:hypothetical protein
MLQVVKDKGLPLDTYIYTAVIDGKNESCSDGTRLLRHLASS